MSIAWAGGDPNDMVQQVAYKVSSTSWPDVAMTVLKQYGPWGVVVTLVGVWFIITIFKDLGGKK